MSIGLPQSRARSPRLAARPAVEPQHRTGRARRLVPVGVWLVLGLLLPQILGLSKIGMSQLDYVLSVVMVACGLNIVWGYAGQLFLGPGALFAVGGYACGVLAEHHTTLQSLPAMVAAAVVVAIALAALTAVPSLRVGGFYLGLVTLFLAFAAPILASRLGFLGSYQGVSLVSTDSFHQRPSGLALYRSGVVLLGILVAFSWLVTHSRLGRRFSALRSGDDLAQALGVPVYRTKVVAFLLGAVPCGAGGAFYVYSQQIVSPASVSPTLSLYVFGAVVIGGAGTTLGPILGASLVMFANQFLGGFTKYEGIVFGAVVVATAVGLPRGLVGLGATARAHWSRLWFGSPGPLRESHAGQAPASASEPGRGSVQPARRGRRRLGDGSADDAEVAPPSSSPGARLVVRSVSRSFGGVRAVNCVDLVVEPAQVHALVGPNGSGKTTLLNLISGFYRLDEGEIWLGQDRLDGHRVSEVTVLGVARTFQTPKLAL